MSRLAEAGATTFITKGEHDEDIGDEMDDKDMEDIAEGEDGEEGDEVEEEMGTKTIKVHFMYFFSYFLKQKIIRIKNNRISMIVNDLFYSKQRSLNVNYMV